MATSGSTARLIVSYAPPSEVRVSTSSTGLRIQARARLRSARRARAKDHTATARSAGGQTQPSASRSALGATRQIRAETPMKTAGTTAQPWGWFRRADRPASKAQSTANPSSTMPVE